MRDFKLGLIGLVFLLLGTALFILIVPTVKTTDLGFWEYLWAVVIIFSTSMGFGLFIMAILGGEEFSHSSPEVEKEKT